MKLADVKQHTNGKEFDYDARLLELQHKAQPGRDRGDAFRRGA